jgi:pimeloyl-ACP methyl ester carboxylesterase
VKPGQRQSAGGVVRLHWLGEAQGARLWLTVAGSEAEHTIRVNGQPIGRAPIFRGVAACGAEGLSTSLEVPTGLLVQGDNLIEITSDALPRDAWSAAAVRLQVLGDVRLNRFGPLAESSSASVLAQTLDVYFTNLYDSSTQTATVQIPDGYNPNTPVPLVVFAHGRYGSRMDGITIFSATANARGWLLASPEMHGRWRPEPNPPGAFAYASLESQYDVIGTVRYMLANYPVKRDQIYLVGYSMGGQVASVTGAKYPDVFAALFIHKAPSDMAQWYSEQVAYYGYGRSNAEQVLAMRRECYVGSFTPADPLTNPFCYQRRSGLSFARNLIHTPISLTHSLGDQLVPISHSHRLRDAINGFGPDQAVAVAENSEGAPPDYHGWDPQAVTVLDALQPYVLDDTQNRLLVRTDESKSYYWLNIQQGGGEAWTEVMATFYPLTSTVEATVSGTPPLELGFNLGAIPLPNLVGMSQPGLGLTAKQYQLRVAGNSPDTRLYLSGYLTVTVTTPGQTLISVAANYPLYLPLIARIP